MAALTGTKSKEHKIVTGGNPPLSSGPCMARTAHGFFGAESEVVQVIAGWIAQH
jgi:hypothetical protein